MGYLRVKVRSMGGSQNGKVNYIGGPDYFKISGPIVVPIAIFYLTFKIFSLGLKKLVSSLTSKPRELDRFRPCFNAYWYLTNYWNQRFISITIY
jgi:hypothetical protein